MALEISGLMLLGLALGLRHGIDWDHIAAITDITSSAVNTKPERELIGSYPGPGSGHEQGSTRVARGALTRGFSLASFYAVGHAAVVVTLGLLAIWASTVLPEWVDPLMERVVGVTLLLLGAWILYSLSRSGNTFRLRSRWMLAFALATHIWAWVKGKITGRPVAHTHEIRQYGRRTAFGIGMIHGIGAETGSQALVLAAAAGATSAAQGTLMLLAFTVGLLISNTAVAVLSVFGFVSSATERSIYSAIAVVAAVSSLIVGLYFATGNADLLPDLQQLLDRFFGNGPST